MTETTMTTRSFHPPASTLVAQLFSQSLDADVTLLFGVDPTSELVVNAACASTQEVAGDLLLPLRHGVVWDLDSYDKPELSLTLDKRDSQGLPPEVRLLLDALGIKRVWLRICHVNTVPTGVIVGGFKTGNRAGDVSPQVSNRLAGVWEQLVGAGQNMLAISGFHWNLERLMRIFDTPASEHRFKDLIGIIVGRLADILPHLGFFVLSGKNGESVLRLGDSFSDQPPSAALIAKATRVALDACGNSAGRLYSDWVELSDDDDTPERTVGISCICKEGAELVFLIGWSSLPKRFSRSDLKLLGMFAIFSRALLRDANYVKHLTRANELLKRSTSRLANFETLAALADMTSGLAHDFNNIIGGVVGRVQLMKLRNKEPGIQRDLETIETLVLSGAETIRRIQEFTTSAKSKQRTAVDINKMVNEYAARTGGNWRTTAANRRIKVTFSADLPSAIVEGVEIDLVTALDKLIENAVEFAYENTEVTVTLTRTNGYFKLRVHNFGPPIDPDDRKRIFYPFFTTKGVQGAGMGLAIVHGIAVRHSGRIEVDSDAERGTAFCVLMPRSDSVVEDSDISRKDVRSGRLRIMVVDDDEQIRNVLADMLMIDGHAVTTCADGYIAVKTFEQQEFDLLITDLGMPGMSGLDLAGIVHGKKPDLPIAMITGWGSQLNQDEIGMKGVRSVLSKPFHLKDIKNLIDEFFGVAG